ncbi:MAG: hypothetical protein BGP06_04605 [Rhizobiales bacterium 65-9]|nr:hypothetical protein [Hyphomicrobiales bacterium]OJY32479.1 MAG: hypothetical protein BGP06_04605 [Rhizobiales bacterium 65-9]
MRLKAGTIALACIMSGGAGAQTIAPKNTPPRHERQVLSEARQAEPDKLADSAALEKPAPPAQRKVRVILSSPYASSAE